MSNDIEVRVPDLGDFSDVEVIEVLVSAGDQIAVDDGLVTLETDKASMEVPSSTAGEVVSVSVEVGATLNEGDVVAVVRVAGSDAPQAELAEPELEASPAPQEAADEAPVAAAPAATRSEQIVVPDIGDFDAVDVIEVGVAVGDQIAVDDALITLETDKASMDVPATVAGVVTAVHVSEGDQVAQGAVIVEVEVSSQSAATTAPATAAAPKPAPAPVKTSEPPAAPPPAKPAQRDSAIDEAGFSLAHASPSVRKLARELGVDLAAVKGTGAKGRIVADDLKAWVKARLSGNSSASVGGALPAVPKVDFAKFGAITETPLTRIQKISGPRLQASWINLPHVTQHDLADITDMDARRKALKPKAAERGIKLTPLAFIMRAVVQTLQEFPRMNSSLTGDASALVQKQYIHIGFAADTEDGLVVPVIHDADQKDVYELADSLAELSSLAREGKLKANHMQGATFTISSLGGIGGTAFTPIVNAPEVGILGVSRSSMQPVWDGEQFVPRLMLPLSLSYDHRVIDGALAARFTTYLGQCLADADGLMQAIP